MKKGCLILSGLLLSINILGGCTTTNRHEQDNLAQVDGGIVAGIQGKNPAVTVFKGIPYAAPPVGSLRWKAPQPAVPWIGIRKCDRFGPSAIQQPQAPFWVWTKEFIIDTAGGYSEDCLTLNIWKKSTSNNKKQPVIVFIHGGAYTSGGSSCDVYDGEDIAAKGIVFVSINYRVGILGFLAHPALSAESSDAVSGNYGILDQIAALKWVQRNIAAFGGDPGNVTVMGQSAGSGSVNSLLISPLARGLFRQAVAESFNFAGRTLPVLSDMEKSGKESFKDKTLQEMRSMTADELLSVKYQSGPVVDGVVIPKQPLDTYKSGTQNNVAVISGNVEGDTALFGLITAKTVQEYKQAAVNTFGNRAEDFLAAYPAADDSELNQTLNRLNIDNMNALQYMFAELRSISGHTDTYIYFFTHQMPGNDGASAFHTADVPYFLNHFSEARAALWKNEDFTTGRIMSSYLVNFAKNGTPNGKGLPAWKPAEQTISLKELGGSFSDINFTPEKELLWKNFYETKFGISVGT